MSSVLKNILFIALVFMVATVLMRIFAYTPPYPTGNSLIPALLWIVGVLVVGGLIVWLIQRASRKRKRQW